jgi:hypothetical protein
VEGDDEQHNTLFSSTCTIGGKVCKLVIDSGSCKNVVAEETVRKLALETKRHPNSYRLEWLKKGTEVIVSKHCFMSFSIGTNTYSFMVDNMKLVLLSSLGNEPKPAKGASHSQSLLTKRKFIMKMLTTKVVYVLLGKEDSNIEVVPEEAKGLVEEFAGVFLAELLEERPPFRDIQH